MHISAVEVHGEVTLDDQELEGIKSTVLWHNSL